MMNKKKDAFWFLTRIFMYAFIVITIVISVFPVVWVAFSSFKTNAEILNGAYVMPSGWQTGLEAYRYLFDKYDFLKYFFNSLIVSVGATVISLVIYSMAGYVLAKYDFPGRNLLFALFTITLLVPATAKAQPIFSLIVEMKLFDTLKGLGLVYISSGMAMSLFILRAAFLAVPKELDEAARVDGAGFLRTFFTVNLPLAKSGLATAGILMFLNNWNEYFYASMLTMSEDARTMPVALQFFNQSFSYDYTKMFAALTLVILPGIILYLLMQKQVQQSIAASGLKG